MKKIAGTCTALALSMPLFAAALTTATDVDVSSGGGTAVSGSAMVTGNSDASADVRTIMRSDDRGTTYRTEIRTESDGVVRTQSEERTIPAGEPAEMRIATSSRDANTEGKHVGRFSGILLSTFWKYARVFFGFF